MVLNLVDRMVEWNTHAIAVSSVLANVGDAKIVRGYALFLWSGHHFFRTIDSDKNRVAYPSLGCGSWKKGMQLVKSSFFLPADSTLVLGCIVSALYVKKFVKLASRKSYFVQQGNNSSLYTSGVGHRFLLLPRRMVLVLYVSTHTFNFRSTDFARSYHISSVTHCRSSFESVESDQSTYKLSTTILV
jgi:hypothetical protein